MTESPSMKVIRIAAPLRRQVLDNIREAIAVGRLPAGGRLVERELCEMTGVSRTLVREALRQLESEGLVEVIANKGPIVAKFSANQAREVYELRAELEGLASELFADRADERQRKALQEAFAALRAAYVVGERSGMLAAKTRFYDCLVQGAGNETLGVMLRQLHARAMVLRGTSLSQPGRTAASEREIAEIMKAIRRRDGAAARKASIGHITKAARVAQQVLESAAGETDELARRRA
ncbi:GntR family transcriptional regulator [Reyranella soli]|uniref:GntR family transcriptional regulator n=2 Tax=Reyranella soli TaxID=1230389 RepID=A0A512N6X2_9HYPH|nr:GntR family transcriptional regulator [Reyranella soli]